MLKFANGLTVLALLIGLVAAIPVSAASSAAPPDQTTVNLRTLEQQVFAEYNNVRTQPQVLAQNLAAMQQSAKPSKFGVTVTMPNGTKYDFVPSYLNSGLSTAQKLQPLKALIWNDGLATAARKYAERNPEGHFSFGTTPSSRIAEFGTGLGGDSESMSWANPDEFGLRMVYRWYVDDNTPSLGHRNMMINPALTHMGVGCYYPNQKQLITCVADATVGWIDKTNEPKLEVGKQYAYREANNTFRYFRLTSLQGETFRIDVCPDAGKLGSISGTGTGALTTPEVAALEGRKAMNAPCSEAVVPLGVLNSGGRYPVSVVPAQGNPPAVATPTVATTQPTAKVINETVNVEEEQLYAQRLAGNTFQYVKYLWHDNSGYRFGVCPNATVLAPITLPNTTSMLTPKTALDNQLTPTNERCPLNTPTYEIGKQYALAHGPGHFTYVTLLAYNKAANSDTRTYTFSSCGYDKKLDLTTLGPFVAVKTVGQVQQEQRVAENKACPNLQNGK